MKIPKGYFLLDGKGFQAIFDAWHKASRKYSMEHGILVTIAVECNGVRITQDDYLSIVDVTRIYFMVDNHEFESLKQLRTALKNKAFL